MVKVVVAALIERKGEFLLCQRRETDKFGGFWEFPGGSIEESETCESAIQREIKEEVNLDIAVDRKLAEFYDESENQKIKVFLFRCSIKGGLALAKECKDCGFFSLREIPNLHLAPVDKKIFSFLKSL
ncbi:MAG: NUDIX domain-containing protein [Candidatus Omnitrophota bacterium]|nr:MAG: NUDIX domain-containing protein [Candidatus Omnitrophota bacterium]